MGGKGLQLLPDNASNAGRSFMAAGLKHYMNPVHIYCRLRDLGLAKRPAIFLCRIYERAIFKYLLMK
jgi:hypothetical protein